MAEKKTIDLVVEEGVTLVRYRRAMYSLRTVVFSHLGQNYRGTVVAVRPHTEGDASAWLVTMLAEPHVEKPLKRARLKRTRRADGEFIVN